MEKNNKTLCVSAWVTCHKMKINQFGKSISKEKIVEILTFFFVIWYLNAMKGTQFNTLLKYNLKYYTYLIVLSF